MKDNFLLKKSQSEVFNGLSDEDAGKLIKGVFNYVITKKCDLDGYLKVIFIPIKNDIDDNEKKYEAVCMRNKENGKLGGAPKGNNNAKKDKTTERLIKQPKTTENNMTRHNHIHNHNQDIKYIIDYLNNKTNSKYKYSAKTTINKINARLNEGYKLDDFIVVIDKKCKDWLNTEFEQYLRPETLFGNKFEGYLNQKEHKNNTPEWLHKKSKKDEGGMTDEEVKQAIRELEQQM